jgi:hypothetical protein
MLGTSECNELVKGFSCSELSGSLDCVRDDSVVGDGVVDDSVLCVCGVFGTMVSALERAMKRPLCRGWLFQASVVND